MTLEILVVDDEEIIRRGLKRLLESHNYQVELASTAEEALMILEKRSFDLVLTDIQMPGIDGLELLREIKNRSAQTPVVMVTAFVVAENILSALRAGASDFVPKPYNPEELLIIVEREATRGQKARQAAAAPEQAPAFLGLQLSPAQLREIDLLLAELRAETGARCVVIVESNGYVIGAKGVIEDINLSALAALVAGDAAATTGIASLIGEGSAFNLNYHEGSRYSIYSANLSQDLFLLVVFGQEVKSGMVLYVTKQILPQLRAIAEQARLSSAAPLEFLVDVEHLETDLISGDGQLYSFDELISTGMLDESALQSLDAEFKRIFGDLGSTGQG